jgi:arylformamidase
MTKIVDLSHPVGIGTEGYPGCAQIVGWHMQKIELKRYNMLHIGTDLHTGTHVDAPLHCVADGLSAAEVSLDDCAGPAWVVDLREKAGAHFEAADFEPYAEAIRRTRRVIVKTGWSRLWEQPEFHRNFPGFRREAAQFLVDLGIRLVGVEQASVHPADHHAVHQVFFSTAVVIVENLAGVEELPDGEVEFFAVPWRFRNGDGSPVRAFARVG